MVQEITLGSGTESSLIITVAFWVISFSAIASAIGVIQTRDLFRAALLLAASFLSIAGLFVLLRAEFIAIVQVLIYIGAISVLMIFAVLTTRDVEHGNPSNMLKIPAALVAVVFFGVAALAILTTDWTLLDDAIPEPGTTAIAITDGGKALSAKTVGHMEDVFGNTIPAIAELLLQEYVLAFEIASLLLLAAIIGALVLVRENSG